MRLTKFVQLPSMRNAFTTTATPLRASGLKSDTPMLASPPSDNWWLPLTGMAFDYLARFIVARRFTGSGVRVVARPWIAEEILGTCLEVYGRKRSESWRKDVAAARELADQFASGIDVSLARLAEYTQTLGNLDCLYRSGQWDLFFRLRTEITADLIELAQVFDPIAQFGPSSAILLNPTFVLDSMLAVGVADADLIIDDLIVDIKTEQSVGNFGRSLRQLAGYAALAELGGVQDGDGTYSVPIRRIGIYSARHATMQVWNLNDLFPGRGWPDYLKAFAAEAGFASPSTA